MRYFTMLLSLLGASYVAVSFWGIDEILRRTIGKYDAILTYNLLYSLGLALLLSPIGYLGTKMMYGRKMVSNE